MVQVGGWASKQKYSLIKKIKHTKKQEKLAKNKEKGSSGNTFLEGLCRPY